MPTANTKKTAAKKTAVKKPAARGSRGKTGNRPGAKASASAKASAKTSAKASAKLSRNKTEPEVATPSQEDLRNVFLAGLGLYGKAFEEAQNQFRENRSKLEQRRERASEIFDSLVKRGEKVERDTRQKLKTLELPELKIPELKLSNREDLRNRLDKARDSFNLLREAVSAKSDLG